MTRASIIIPALNEAENLSRNLPEVRNQLWQDDEVVVVDNGSDDGTADISANLGAIVVHEPIRGRSRARNCGIRHAKGEVLVFLDADCVPEKSWLEQLYLPFSDPEVGCVAGEIVNIDSGKAMDQYLRGKNYLSQSDNFKHSFLPFGATANLAFRRLVLQQIGLFDESLQDGEDADLCWRMQLETGYRLVLASSSVVRHMHSFSATDLLRQKRRHSLAAARLYKKYCAHWKMSLPPLKSVYWEYRSIARRGVLFGCSSLAAKLRLSSPPPAAQGFQLLLEIGDKLGRLQGSFRHRVWFP